METRHRSRSRCQALRCRCRNRKGRRRGYPHLRLEPGHDVFLLIAAHPVRGKKPRPVYEAPICKPYRRAARQDENVMPLGLLRIGGIVIAEEELDGVERSLQVLRHAPAAEPRQFERRVFGKDQQLAPWSAARRTHRESLSSKEENDVNSSIGYCAAAMRRVRLMGQGSESKFAWNHRSPVLGRPSSSTVRPAPAPLRYPVIPERIERRIGLGRRG